jgi:hypothetical protein
MTDNIITSEIISNHIIYICNISKSEIIFERNNNILKINNMNFNWDLPKLVLNLINYSIGDIIKKSNNLQKFNYCVSKNDYDYLDKNKWIIKNTYDEYYELECDIINSTENILYGFMNT